MRTIKFRGKDATTNDGRYGDMTHTKGITESGLYDRAMVGGYEVTKNTVGQFVGFLDYKNKEIYEGDIIHYDNGDFIESGNYVVEWDKLSTAFKINDENLGEFRGGNFDEDSYADYYRVIGNIYDNPELLESEVDNA